jgi:hypothetical protein
MNYGRLAIVIAVALIACRIVTDPMFKKISAAIIKAIRKPWIGDVLLGPAIVVFVYACCLGVFDLFQWVTT